MLRGRAGRRRREGWAAAGGRLPGCVTMPQPALPHRLPPCSRCCCVQLLRGRQTANSASQVGQLLGRRLPLPLAGPTRRRWPPPARRPRVGRRHRCRPRPSSLIVSDHPCVHASMPRRSRPAASPGHNQARSRLRRLTAPSHAPLQTHEQASERRAAAEVERLQEQLTSAKLAARSAERRLRGEGCLPATGVRRRPPLKERARGCLPCRVCLCGASPLAHAYALRCRRMVQKQRRRRDRTSSQRRRSEGEV